MSQRYKIEIKQGDVPYGHHIFLICENCKQEARTTQMSLDYACACGNITLEDGRVLTIRNYDLASCFSERPLPEPEKPIVGKYYKGRIYQG